MENYHEEEEVNLVEQPMNEDRYDNEGMPSYE